jgi:hypothetical protein
MHEFHESFFYNKIFLQANFLPDSAQPMEASKNYHETFFRRKKSQQKPDASKIQASFKG